MPARPSLLRSASRPSPPAKPIAPDAKELRELVFQCFTHLGAVLLPAAHIVRAFLYSYWGLGLPPYRWAYTIGLAHGTIRALEGEGRLRCVRQFEVYVPFEDRELCPKVSKGILCVEVQLVVPAERLAPTAKEPPDVSTADDAAPLVVPSGGASAAAKKLAEQEKGEAHAGGFSAGFSAAAEQVPDPQEGASSLVRERSGSASGICSAASALARAA